MFEKIIKTIAGLISINTSPIIMPTYGMALSLWSTHLVFAPASTRWQVLLLTFAATAMLPVIVIFFLSKAGIIKHPSLNDRNDRPYVYAAATMTYLGIAIYLWRINSPQWLSMFMLAAAITAVVTMIVNFRWKISGHATAAGSLTTFTFFLCFKNLTLHNNEWLFVVMALVTGLVMTSRLILKRHTLSQVTAGFFNGVFWVALFELLAK